MRGKRTVAPIAIAITGITPADAGKTFDWGLRDELNEDHPRGCGENHALYKFYNIAAGSPPRMRGKH